MVKVVNSIFTGQLELSPKKQMMSPQVIKRNSTSNGSSVPQLQGSILAPLLFFMISSDIMSMTFSCTEQFKVAL